MSGVAGKRDGDRGGGDERGEDGGDDGAVKSEAMRGSGKKERGRGTRRREMRRRGSGSRSRERRRRRRRWGRGPGSSGRPPPSPRSRSGSCATGRMHLVGHASVTVRRGNRGAPSNFYVLRTMQRLRPLFSLVRSRRLSRVFCICPGHKVFAAMTHLAVLPIRCSWVRKTKKVLTSSGFCC